MSVNQKCNTSCKECIFAVYDYKTQIGCDLDRIEAYRKKGDDVVLEAYDNEKEFFVINNYKCSCFRNKYYALNRPNQNHKESVLNDIKTKFCIIIYANNDIDGVKSTLINLKHHGYPIEEIVIILDKNEEPDKMDYITMASELLPGITWRVNVLQQSLSHYKTIDMVLHHNKRHFNFFTHLNAYEHLPDGVLQKIDDIINKEINVASAIQVADHGSYFTFYNFALYNRIETPDRMYEFDRKIEGDQEWKKEMIYI